MKEFKKHDLETWNEEEEDRLELLAITKLRGKGAPKKKREKDRKNRHPYVAGETLMNYHSQERQEEVMRWNQQALNISRYPRPDVQYIDTPTRSRPGTHICGLFPELLPCGTTPRSSPWVRNHSNFRLISVQIGFFSPSYLG